MSAPIQLRDTILTIAFDTDSTTLSYMNATERRIRESDLIPKSRGSKHAMIYSHSKM